MLANTGSTDEQLIKLSQLYLRVEKFNDVIDNLFPIYNAGNHSLDVLRMLLIAFSSLDQTENEVIISEILIKEYPELPVGFEALSFAYIQAGDNNKAVEVLLQALTNFPNEVSFPFSLATIFNNSRKFVKAENYYHTALSIQPDLIAAKHALAIMYEDMNDTNRSDSLFLHMINQNENDAGGRNDYAYILSERKESSKDDFNYALQLAESAIAIDPENAAFLDTIGWIYYKLETYQKAEEFLEKSLSINDNNPVILEHLGDIYIKLNKTTEAINIYEKILKIDSDNQIIRNKINNIYD
jgi:tetratricopeptide (TPR) repeat protein